MGIVLKYDGKNIFPMIFHSRLEADVLETIMKLQTSFGIFFSYFFIWLCHLTPSTHISSTMGGLWFCCL